MTTKRVGDLALSDVGKTILIDLKDGGVQGLLAEIIPEWYQEYNLMETRHYLSSVDLRLKGGLLIEGLRPSQEITFPSTM